MAMQPRLDPYKVSPAMMALEAAVAGSGIEETLIDLVKTRASQINGCAYCIHMHTSDARARGETEARLYLLDAWRESPLYTDRERAALGTASQSAFEWFTHRANIELGSGACGPGGSRAKPLPDAQIFNRGARVPIVPGLTPVRGP